VAAFRATLEELQDADLLVHLVDITHKNAPEQVQTVHQLLGELGVGETPVLLALNKVDLLLGGEQLTGPDGAAFAGLQDLVARVAPPSEAPDAVPISAVRGWGVDALLQKVEDTLSKNWLDVKLRLPYAASDLVAMVHQHGVVKAESYQPDGVLLDARLPRRFVAQVQAYTRT
jgi:GTP-binding protein HflX